LVDESTGGAAGGVTTVAAEVSTGARVDADVESTDGRAA
jgi:hypothetical protein